MKPFNFDEVNTNGFEFVQVKAQLHFTNGLTVEMVQNALTHVSVSPNVVPAQFCDLVTGLGSVDSNSFYEKGGLPEINDLSARWGYVSFHCLCLPDNIEEVKKAATEHLQAFGAKYLAERKAEIESLENILK